jgi:hypothetical protein
MGFPLSTDIFGQLRWLVRQVKLLVFRVTKIEQGGGGGAQNINQVLATGNTAANKFLQFDSSVNSSALKIGNDIINGLSIFLTDDITSGAVSSTNLTSTGFSQLLNGGDATSNLTASSLIFSNDADSVSTTYGLTGITSTNNSYPLGLNFDFTTGFPIIKTTFNGNDAGFYFYNNKAFVLGKNNVSHIGIDTNTNILIGAGIRQIGSHNIPAGFVQINIDGTPYWIELWNDV